METIKIHIRVDQSEAIRQGKNHYGDAVIEINPADLTPEQRNTLATCETWQENSRAEYIRSPHYSVGFSSKALPQVGEATLETARVLLDALAEWRIRRVKEVEEEKIRAAAEKKRQIEDNIAQILAQTDEWLADNIEGGRPINSPAYYRGFYIRRESADVYTDPRVADKMDRAIILQESRNRERVERERAMQEKKEAAEKILIEADLRKRVQIADYVTAHGTENQKKRAALNLLPDDEVLNMMRDEAFAPLAGFERYEKITKHEIIAAGYCDCDDDYADSDRFTYDVNDATEASAEDFETMEKIMDLMPGATVTLREHQGYCDTCYEKDDEMIIIRNSIRVAVTVGAFGFTREYAV